MKKPIFKIIKDDINMENISMKKTIKKKGAGAFLPKIRYDLPINNTDIVKPYTTKKMVYSMEIDDEIEKESVMPPLMGEGYNVENMYQLGFHNHIPSVSLASYSINYNCIGWAFDLDDFIEPIMKKGEYIMQEYVLNNQLNDFIIQCGQEYKSQLTDNGVVFRLGTSSKLTKYKKNYKFKENDVVFYFGIHPEAEDLECYEPVLLHAARYFDVSRPYPDLYEGPELRWTSKMGDMLLVSHELCDLIGEAYGEITDMLVTG